MEQYAKEKHICIVLPETRIFLKELCVKLKPKKILEVGMAIGYSASVMLSSCEAHITCCEASLPNIKLAKQNFERLKLSDRVDIVAGDCLKTLPDLQGQVFDLIFLDGPKGLYPDILKLLLPLLSNTGVLVADNISFRGMVEGEPITQPRFEKTVQALRRFIQDIQDNKELKLEIKKVGDGLALVQKR